MRRGTTMAICRSRSAADVADYSEGHMTRHEKMVFETHLLSCAPCRTAVRGLLKDLAILGKPDFPAVVIRPLLNLLMKPRQLVFGLLQDGLKIPSLGRDRRFIPEFVPAVRGGDRRRVRQVRLPFSFPPVTGSAKLVFRSRESAILECRIDRCGVKGRKKISLFRGGRVMEEKMLPERPGSAAEFGPVGKGAYALLLGGKKILSLRIV